MKTAHESSRLDTARAMLARTFGRQVPALIEARPQVVVTKSGHALLAELERESRKSTARARALANIRSRALDLARGNDALAGDVSRLLRSELVRGHEYTAGAIADALGGDVEVIAEWSDMADDDSNECQALARRVLSLCARLSIDLEAIRADSIEALAQCDSPAFTARGRRRPGRRVGPSHAVAVRGSIERNGPNRVALCAPAANGRRHATRTAGGSTPG